MKKIILLALFLSSKLFCFELLYNTGRENDQAFGVLHLRNEENFTCQEIHIDGKNHFECTVLGNVDTTLQDRAFQFFDLNFTKKDLRTDIKISPKIPAKMYNLAQDLYNDNVVLKKEKVVNETASGIILSNKEKETEYATVVAVGSGSKDEKGNLVPMDVKVGDKVIYRSYSTTSVKIDDEEYLIVANKDILATIE